MERLFSVLLAICFIPLCAGCGNVFLSASSQPSFSTATGLVSVVQLSTVIGRDGTTVQVTFVTFLQDGTSSTIGFCGDKRSEFPMQQTLRAEFRPGSPCASIVTIVII